MFEWKKRPKVEAAPVEQEAPKPLVVLPETEGITNQLREAERQHEDLVSVCSVCYREHCWIEPHIWVQRGSVR